MPFKTNLIVTPTTGRTLRLCQDLVYQDEDGTLITLMAGFESDGESGPEILKSIVLPYTGYRQWPAMTHDGLYQAGLPKAYCDQVYRRALLSLPIESAVSEALYEAVHLFGGSSYRLDQQDIDKAHRAVAHLRITLPPSV